MDVNAISNEKAMWCDKWLNVGAKEELGIWPKSQISRLQGFSDVNSRKKKEKKHVRKELVVRLDEHQVQHQVYKVHKCRDHADGWKMGLQPRRDRS